MGTKQEPKSPTKLTSMDGIQFFVKVHQCGGDDHGHGVEGENSGLCQSGYLLKAHASDYSACAGIDDIAGSA